MFKKVLYVTVAIIAVAFATVLLFSDIFSVGYAQRNLNARFGQLDVESVTATASELNILDGVTADYSELNFLDGSVAGTAVASKALVVNANKDVDYIGITTYMKLALNDSINSKVVASSVDTTGFTGGEMFFLGGDTLYVYKADHTIISIP